jgi:hypothetical protein
MLETGLTQSSWRFPGHCYLASYYREGLGAISEPSDREGVSGQTGER